VTCGAAVATPSPTVGDEKRNEVAIVSYDHGSPAQAVEERGRAAFSLSLLRRGAAQGDGDAPSADRYVEIGQGGEGRHHALGCAAMPCAGSAMCREVKLCPVRVVAAVHGNPHPLRSMQEWRHRVFVTFPKSVEKELEDATGRWIGSAGMSPFFHSAQGAPLTN
jgi:hypothetical protein